MSGDALTNIDLEQFILFHLNKKPLVSIAAKVIENPIGFGIIEADADGNILSFIEKPENPKRNSLINTGIYMMNTKVLEYVPQGFCDFSKDVFPRILQRVKAYATDAYWSDIGTLEAYYLANRDVVVNNCAFNYA